jgi:hypothetical protein
MATAAVARRYASLAADHDWLARDLLRCGRSRPRVLERSVRQVDAVFGERGAGGLDGKISRNDLLCCSGPIFKRTALQTAVDINLLAVWKHGYLYGKLRGSEPAGLLF